MCSRDKRYGCNAPLARQAVEWFKKKVLTQIFGAADRSSFDVALLDNFASAAYKELDYVCEATNQATSHRGSSSSSSNSSRRNSSSSARRLTRQLVIIVVAVVVAVVV